MAKPRKKGEKVRHVHIDKHAKKRSLRKSSQLNSGSSGKDVDVEEMRTFLRGFDRPETKKKIAKR